MSTNAPRENVSTSAAVKKSAKGDSGKKSLDLQFSTFTGFLILVVVTLIVYSPVFRADFIWDDNAMIWDNALIRVPNGLSQIWFSTSQSDYFPLTYSSFWFEWRLWGMHAKGYHVTNILLHAFSAFFLWRSLRALKIPGAFWAALLFAVHPVNVESVAWIAERKNTLSMLFFTIALLFYVLFENSKAKLQDSKVTNDYWWALAAFTLALLSKTAVVMFPFLALGCAWWLHGRITKRDILGTAPFFGVALLLGLATVWFQYNRAISTTVVNGGDVPTRLAVAGWNVWFYLYKAVCPLELIFVYPRWNIDSHNALAYLPALAVLLTLGASWMLRRTLGRAPFFAFAYFVVMLVPVLGFLDIYFFRFSFVADHYQYFAIIGIVAFIAALATHFLKQRAVILLVVLAAVFSVQTWRQAHIYKNHETLWRDTLAKNPQCAMAESNWGYHLAETEHNYPAAIEHYVAALKLNPKDAGTHYLYGVALISLNRIDDAVSEFRETLKLEPDNSFALQNLGWIEATSKHAHLRNPEHALQVAKRGVEVSKREDPWQLDTFAAALAANGKFDEAITTQEEAVAVARRKNDSNAVADMEQRLGLYRIRQPYRESD
ncbi:MAG: ogt [Verrucomicrobiales bacterium]|nr:ogt [Verrucomicrobiales bacterium]